MTYLLEDYCKNNSGRLRSKIEAFNVVKGCESSVTLSERNININLSRYAYLNAGETESIIVSYKVVNDFGLELPKLAYFFVEGTENRPRLSCSSFEVKMRKCGNMTVRID